MKTVVCITTYNEQETISGLVLRLRSMGYDVIVIDDSSTDDTAYNAHIAGAHVEVTTQRLGIGPCMASAWRLALDKNYQRIAQIDAGGSHNPHFLPPMVEGEADVVIGSRFMPGAEYIGRGWRKWLSKAAAMACNFAQPGMKVSDWTSGYRVFSPKAIETLLQHPYKAVMHAWQIETLARAGGAKLNIVEMPITYKAGKSSFNWHVALEAFRTWLYIIGSHDADSTRLYFPQ